MLLVNLDAVIDCLELEWGYEGMREDLYSLPVVDAVPVVRCKDCKHSYVTIGARCCSRGAFYDVAVPDDFFCALAERKGSDGND